MTAAMDYDFLHLKYLEKEIYERPLHLYTSIVGRGLILRRVELPKEGTVELPCEQPMVLPEEVPSEEEVPLVSSEEELVELPVEQPILPLEKVTSKVEVPLESLEEELMELPAV